MDPASALGVASSAIQIFDFSAQLWKKIRDLYESESGMSSAHDELRTNANKLRDVNSNLSRLLTPGNLQRGLTESEESVVSICNECDTAAEQLVVALEDLSLHNAEDEDGAEAEHLQSAIGGNKRKLGLPSFSRTPRSKRLRPLERKWEAVQGAVKEIWMRKDVNKLCERLEDSKRDLANAILVNIQHELVESQRASTTMKVKREANWSTAKTFGDWLRIHRLDTSQAEQNLLNVLRTQLKDSMSGFLPSRSYYEPSPAAPGDSAREHHTLKWSSSARYILDSLLLKLDFPAMYDRQERIPDSYKGTLEWIYSDPRDQDMPWDSFSSWLTNGRGIYWITGKAGSGKSTLMRMLHECEQTDQFLRAWSSAAPLIRASFFFWNSGSELQMSQDGLFRTILFQILQQRLASGSRIFKKKLEAIALSAESSETQFKELLQLFRLVIEDDSESVRYFLLLDGLDEFDGDKSRLISLIQTLGAYDNVKICVSSRPWVVFEDGFRQQPSLVLQHLTHNDISFYIRENLQKQPAFREMAWADPSNATGLVDNITKKASGVFLWVVLVVNSLIKGLSDGDRVKDLQARLDEIPDELEDLFRKMLHGLEGRYFKDAARLFQIHAATKWEGFAFDNSYVVPLLAYSFADEFGVDHDKAIRWPIATMTPKECFMRSVSMKRRLNSRCNGLLEIGEPARRTGETWRAKYRNLDKLIADAESGDVSVLPTLHSYGQELAKSSVQYLHRTVKDYLENPDVWDIIESASATERDDYWVMSLCLAHLFLWKTSPPSTQSSINSSLASHGEGAGGHWSMFEEHDFKSMLERYLAFAMQFLPNNKTTHFELLETLGAAIFREDSPGLVWKHIRADIIICRDPNPDVEFRLPDNFLSLAVHCNLFEYVDNKLLQAQLPGPEVSRYLQFAVLKRESLLTTAPAPFSDDSTDDSNSPEPEIATRDGPHLAYGHADEWIGHRTIDGPNLHMVHILLRHGADPDCKAHKISPRQLVQKRIEAHKIHLKDPSGDLATYEEILDIFKAWTASSKTSTGLTAKAKKIFN